MNLLSIPWLELCVLLSLLGAISVSRVSNPFRAYQYGLGFTGSVFVCSFLAWLGYYLGVPPNDEFSLQMRIIGRRFLELDGLSAPLVPAVALLHFLTALATARTKMRRFSFSWSLASETIRLATFGCRDPLAICVLMLACVVPGYI
jgi:NADH-quinone oxidoreductase subunit M